MMSVRPIRRPLDDSRALQGVTIELNAVEAKALHDFIHRHVGYNLSVSYSPNGEAADTDGVVSQLSMRLLTALRG